MTNGIQRERTISIPCLIHDLAYLYSCVFMAFSSSLGSSCTQYYLFIIWYHCSLTQTNTLTLTCIHKIFHVGMVLVGVGHVNMLHDGVSWGCPQSWACEVNKHFLTLRTPGQFWPGRWSVSHGNECKNSFLLFENDYFRVYKTGI